MIERDYRMRDGALVIGVRRALVFYHEALFRPGEPPERHPVVIASIGEGRSC
ncbi:MAG: hypothetical protein HQL38_20745 [Alphaproteobacteria bacterium]|nr:hypothetical protein [Alphaproteobacteria bacterium]